MIVRELSLIKVKAVKVFLVVVIYNLWKSNAGSFVWKGIPAGPSSSYPSAVSFEHNSAVQITQICWQSPHRTNSFVVFFDSTLSQRSKKYVKINSRVLTKVQNRICVLKLFK